MKLVYTSSASHDILKDFIFLGTLKDNWELIEFRDTSILGDYRSKEWQNVIINRARNRLDIAKKYTGERIVFSDIDIQWFNPAQDIINNYLNKYDCVFQRENVDGKYINGGFICIKCNKDSIKMLETTLFLLESDFINGNILSDQETFNRLIKNNEMPCSYTTLPITFLNDNIPESMIPQPKDIIMYHSVKTMSSKKSSIQLKLEQHLKARAYFLGVSNIFKDI